MSGYLLVLPFLVLLGAFGVLPLLLTGWIALHDWHLVNGSGGFTGLRNFAALAEDPRFWNALANTASIFLIATVPQLFAALVLAWLLDRPLRAGALWRSTLLLPNVVAVTAVALVFGQLYAPSYGVVNTVLEAIGLNGIDWRNDRLAAHIAIATMVMWRWTGYNALLYLAAMRSVPPELHEAAVLDGASSWRVFWSVTVPWIRPTVLFTVAVSTIGGLQLFTEPLLFDDAGVSGTGGAGRQFQTLAMYMYEQGFTLLDAGHAAAVGWVLMFACGGFALFNVLLARRIPVVEE